MNGHMLKSIVGHAEKGITHNTYMTGYEASQLHAELEKCFTPAVDLEHLKKSRFVIDE